MPTIDISGVPHAYELTSPSTNPSTPVLIFIHGWLLSRQYWLPLINKLSPDYPCLTYDLKGFGDSQPLNNFSLEKYNSSSPYTLEAYAQDLIILLEKLNIQRGWLIGHSLGGSIALWTADLCPEKIQGVVCLNAGGGIYLKEEFERFRLAGQQLVKYRPPWLCRVPLIDILFSRMMVAKPIDRQWGKQRVIDLIRANSEAALSSLLDSTTESEVHLLPQIVSRLAQPVYFFSGDKDTVMEPQYVRYLASFHELFKYQGQNVIDVLNCGHLSMVEHPDLLGEKMLNILMTHEV
ncbi:alpha/beta fold hydrolase [Crocosphaera chwakensis]|uniref:Esterase n=1 Tax=Crocosphaera chwakensis CCY0110 TaxID=391612 RepID=A3IPR9_9CHRO|nr:alpha/beta hydrolase [Crocosphaera chwakensis]EAZ91559.1 esterase [Crocosphaera chwakensis CCY0110]